MANVYEENREEKHTRGGLEITRTLRVEPYTYAPTAIALLLGEIKLAGGGFTRILPHRDPLYPSCRCQAVDVSPVETLNVPGVVTTNLAVLSSWGRSASARLVATYRPLDGEDNSDQPDEIEYAQESFDFKYLVQQSNNQWWSFADEVGDDGIVQMAREGAQFAKTYPVIDYMLTRNYVLQLPTLSICKLMNKVNKSPFSFSKKINAGVSAAQAAAAAAGTPATIIPASLERRTWAAETMRFEGAQISRRFTNKSVPFYTVGMRFSILAEWGLCGDIPGAPALVTSGAPPVTTFDESKVKYHFVGWNRIYRFKRGFWQYPKLNFTTNTIKAANQDRIYLHDEDVTETIKGKTVKGFKLLFTPGAP